MFLVSPRSVNGLAQVPPTSQVQNNFYLGEVSNATARREGKGLAANHVPMVNLEEENMVEKTPLNRANPMRAQMDWALMRGYMEGVRNPNFGHNGDHYFMRHKS